MRAFKYIRDMKAFELLADETRRRIIYLLRAKEMTVSQLSAELGITTQAVYHQISKLREAGLVEVAREERIDHFIETYYRATAEVFELRHGEAEGGESEKRFKEAFAALAKAGLEVTAGEDAIRKVSEIHADMDKLGLPPELEEKISELGDVAFFTKSRAYELAQLALMSDKQFDKMVESEKALRKLVKAGVSSRAQKS